ncbi:MAG: prepilin-type cleavage/methylation domain-containing protein [Halanaerobium sp. MSAO_Bac5]|nr:MAG: prepilin-type cleavage/methylation domain-containing protein [Halanaerobium sp. MSAO_Bac5]
MLVLLVVGILFSSSYLYRANTAQHHKLGELIDSLGVEFRWARNRAVIDNQSYIFRIYSSPNSGQDEIPYYFYTIEEGREVIKKKGSYPAHFLVYKTLDHQLITDQYYEWIRFSNTSAARGGTIAFSAPGSKIYSITVNQLGRVRIEK